MEKIRINVAELIKDCPQGMELDSTMYDNLYFDSLNADYYNTINCYTLIDGIKTYINFTKYGTFNNHKGAKCVIFPKGKTTWEGFHMPLKNGDIVTWKDRGSLVAFIYKERKDITVVKHHFALYTGNLGIVTDGELYLPEDEIVFATKEERQKLFQAIKDNGYYWDAETNTLKNLFTHKIGTKVWVKSDTEHKYVHTIVGISRNSFGNLEYEVKEEKTGTVVHYPEELLIPVTTKEPQFKTGDVIKHKYTNIYCTLGEYSEGISAYRTNVGLALTYKDLEHWELTSDKFDITTLKPFDKVLVRDFDSDAWDINFFKKLLDGKHFKCLDVSYTQCIPYEGNEYLFDTTDNCNSYYN